MKHNPNSAAKVRRWTIPALPPVAEEEGVREESSATHPADQLRHGYTLDHLQALTHIAVKLTGPMAADYSARFDAAWFGAVELLYSSTDAPARTDLIAAARRALQNFVRGELHTRGIPRNDTWRPPGSVPAFARFWFNPPSGGHDERVVERVALGQIFDRLTARQREALLALAALDDYQLAADALGVTRATLNAHLSQGRRRFLALWHEGETPSRQWRLDKRVYSHAAKAAAA